MKTAPYQTSPIKRQRRSKADLAELLDAAKKIIDGEESQITIRHLFYRLVSIGAIEKTQQEYHRLCHLLTVWRRSGDIEWSAFSDNTRWRYGAETFDSVQEALRNTVQTYRKNLWSQQDHYVEAWCEKDAIASILLSVADDFGVKVFPFRGFASLSSLFVAADTFKRMERAGKECHIFYFGDHDPSGVLIEPVAQRSLQKDFGVTIDIERVAVTVAQIEQYKLPTRPTKKSDSRSRTFKGESVEVDAMSPRVLRQITQQCITQYIDAKVWAQMQRTEELEKASLEEVLETFQGGAA